jgi:hypothetical protein
LFYNRTLEPRETKSLASSPITSPRRHTITSEKLPDIFRGGLAFEVQLDRKSSNRKRNPVQARLEEEAKEVPHKRAPSQATLDWKLNMAAERRQVQVNIVL